MPEMLTENPENTDSRPDGRRCDCAALVALDWGAREHAFTLRMGDQTETGRIVASAEALHAWLAQFGQRFGQRSVALAIEGGRNAVMHALVDYPWLALATSTRWPRAASSRETHGDGARQRGDGAARKRSGG